MRNLILLCFLLFQVFSSFPVRAQTWSSLGIGFDTICYALTTDANGNVYAGGLFEKALTSFGNVKEVNHVARWNGSEWLPLGKGVDGPVYALAMDKNNRYLYVGGSFSNAYNSNGTFISTPNIARWDKLTGNWSAVGSGLDDDCLALFIDDNNTVYAGGAFDKAGGKTAHRIAKWEGGAWSALGSGLTGTCSEIKKDKNGLLYVAGYINSAGGIAVKGLTRWNGSIWEKFTPDFYGATQSAFALVFDAEDRLYVGGYFHGAGNVESFNIILWDGSAWQSVGGGLKNGLVLSLALDSLGNIFLGGGFTQSASGFDMPYIAYWNGNWNDLSPGPDDYVRAIAIGPAGRVYAAGDFTIAGNVEARYIAQWTPAWVGTEQIPEKKAAINIYPQPAGDYLHMDLQEAFPPSDELTLTIRAGDGRILKTRQLSGSSAYQLFIADLPRGLYLLQVQSAKKQITRAFIRQ